jgi:hypothetical protein
MKTLLAVACLLAVAAPTLAADAKAPTEKVVQRKAVTGRDLAEVLGVAVYKYRLDLPKDAKFRLVVREFGKRGAAPRVHHTFNFQRNTEKPGSLRIAFLRNDGKLGIPMLRDDQLEMEYRVSVTGCSQAGFATNISVPLLHLEATRKMLLTALDDQNKVKGGDRPIRLLTVVQREPGKVPPPATSYPRWEVVIERDR